MNRKSWVLLLLFWPLLFQLADCQQLKNTNSYTIHWMDNLVFYPNEYEKIELLYFENAISDNFFPTLPLFFQKIAVDNFYTDYEVTISNEVYKPLTNNEINLIPSNFDQKVIPINISTKVEKMKFFTVFSFIPIRKNGQGTYEKLISFDITFSGKGKGVVSKDSKSYKTNSILKNGLWFRFSIAASGIYKVSYSDLVSMGYTGGSFSSENIALFGNGGGMLPELNGTPRHDDLIENPIQIFDGGDNLFNEGDYFIFYGQSPHSVTFNPNNLQFSHKLNIYSDLNYYFITTTPGIGEKLRINSANNSNLTANFVVNDYVHFDFLEDDIYNILESGQDWFGDKFDIITTRSYNLSVPGIKASTARLSINTAVSPSSITSSFSASLNGSSIGTLFYSLTPFGSGYVYDTLRKDFYISTSSPSLKIDLTYSKPTSSSVGYLDWIEIQATCNLTMHSPQFPFCQYSSLGEGNITQYNIGNATANTTVWDVTDPLHPFAVTGSLQNGTLSIKSHSDILHQFVAFNGSAFLTVSPIGIVSNQDLHDNSLVDFIIVAHPDFVSAAQELASFRRGNNNLTVRVVTPQQIYNEFSSGKQDPTAIRDYIKMIYDKSDGAYPSYLLLFGRPSFDYRGRVEETSIFVPNYQTDCKPSHNDLRSNDDFFGLMDNNEGVNCGNGLIDVAVGRFPSINATQAATAVAKSINYTKKMNLVTGNNNSTISNLADWRNVLSFIADDEDANEHIRTADLSAQIIDNLNKNINIDKIYCDAYVQVSNSGGQRYPDVNNAITNRMNRGSLIMTYVGHGGKDGWAHERILETSDMTKFNNLYNQPLLITLTCDFGWYDRPTTSPAEIIFFNANGGATSLITTSRVAFTGTNASYAKKLFENLFTKIDNRYKTVGEINMTAKNFNGGVSNGTNMIYLIGDPSMPLAVPQYNIVTDSINGVEALHFSDTLGALSKVTIKGRITDENDNTLTNFNGDLYPTIFDKKILTTTLRNDPATSNFFEFETQKNILFKGNSSVNNGQFEFSFIIPKDINYAFGKGKISYYSRSSNNDGTGNFTNIIIGGMNSNAVQDDEGPIIELYMNDENFVNNGITDPNPIFIAKLQDQYGINTTGNGIGHDLIAIIDDATESQIILNDYYEAIQDSFNCGTIRYPLRNLAIGNHTIKFRAWDITNNVSEKTINFSVISDTKLAIDHVLNYPNPFTTKTSFFFEHNQVGQTFDIIIQIFTISGKLVKTLEATQTLNGNRSEPIDWDGRDDFGDKIGKGVYIYKLKIRTVEGETAEKIEKIVIL